MRVSNVGENVPGHNMIEMEQASLVFPGSNKPILDNVSFQINGGQIFALLGPNGAGKTTLVRILATLILPSSGRVKVCGYDVVRDAAKVRKCISMCSDSQRSFYFRLTGYQNLEFFGGLTGVHRKVLRMRIDKVLERVELAEARNELFMHYSHGMRKKLSLARSLLSDAKVYLMDEPTSGIDPCGAVAIRQIMKELQARGKTILLTTHNIEEASRISNYVGILKKGSIVAFDSPDNLKQIVQKKQISVILQSTQYASGFASRVKELSIVSNARLNQAKVEIDIEKTSSITPILQMIADSGILVETIREKEATLEDLFIRIARS